MNINLCAKTTFKGEVKESLTSPFIAPLLPSYDHSNIVEDKVGKVFKFTVPATVAASTLKATALKAMAATTVATATGVDIMSKLMPLVYILQDIALPVGICVASWGLIEIIIGNPGGRQKVKYSVIGYAALFLIPFVFMVIRDTLRGLI